MTSDASRSDRLVLYVDGFNLYHGLRAESHCEHLWIDVVALAGLLRPRSEVVAVRYFTAPVLGDPEAASRQEHHLRAMQARHPSVLEIVRGRYQRRTWQCRACESKIQTYEEKESDVNVAVNLVADAAQGRMDTAILLSADSDMAPAVRTAWRIAPDLTILAAFPPNRNSAELKDLMPGSFHVGMDKVRRAQMPNVFTVDGKEFCRPDKWVSDPSWRPPRRRRRRSGQTR